MTNDLTFDHVHDHFNTVGGMASDAFQVLGSVFRAHGQGNIRGFLVHRYEKVIEYLMVKIVDESICLTYSRGKVCILRHKGIEAVLTHLFRRFSHALVTDMGFRPFDGPSVLERSNVQARPYR